MLIVNDSDVDDNDNDVRNVVIQTHLPEINRKTGIGEHVQKHHIPYPRAQFLSVHCAAGSPYLL